MARRTHASISPTDVSACPNVTGALYLVASAIGFVGLIYVPDTLIVRSDAAATASNIIVHEWLFRWGIVSYAFVGALWLFVPLALYRLLSGVDKDLAALMVILGGLMQSPIYVINAATSAVALLLVRGGAEFQAAFDKPQRDALAMVFLRLHDRIDTVVLVFAGLWLLPFGLLVYRSRFLPRILGIWLMVACFAWLAVAFVGLLTPEYQGKVFSATQPLAWGEIATMLWLIIMGAKGGAPLHSGMM
ncbi:MAG TPA: DUF4386 domain-containing protein [Gemmatimonadales bacterium]|nr:DUF4386 domain-containing protein [Gemmatimonadales bacterium]